MQTYTASEIEQINHCYKQIQQMPDENSISLLERILSDLDQGRLRVAEPGANGEWQVHEWVKAAISLYFRVRKVSLMHAGDLQFVDKIPSKVWRGDEGVRIVPPGLARFGCYLSPGAILMPSFVNVGAWVGPGTMVDTWATVGSCAQIGANVHLSGGVGVGGVLEPLQASPVIIEDGAFIGSRCILVEGAHIQAGAVIGAGVTITQSTKIIDVNSGKTYQGLVPKNSVVIPGSLKKTFPAGEYGVPCALIVGQRKESTNLKTSLNEALREFDVAP